MKGTTSFFSTKAPERHRRGHLRVRFFFATAFLIHSTLLVAQNPPTAPKELADLTTKFLEAKTREIDTPFATRRAQVDKNYVNALTQAAETATADGDLETVLEVRKEITRVKQGGIFEGVTAYRQFKTRELVETYGKFLAQSESERSKLVNALTEQLDRGLNQLVVDLTKQGRVEDAVRVKTFREGPEMKQLALGGGSGSLDEMHAALATLPTPAGGSPMTTGRPTNATPASGPTRVVIVPLQAGGSGHPVFEAIAAADFGDVIYIGKSIFPIVGMVRADGTLVHWRGDSGAPEQVPGTATLCVHDHLLPLIALNADGSLASSTTDDADLSSKLKAETQVSHVFASSGVLSVVRKDGSLTVLGPRASVATTATMIGMKEVSQVGFSGAAFASVLKSDGTVIEIANGAPRPVEGHRDLVKLHSHLVGENRSGEVVAWGTFPEEILDELGRRPIQVFAENRRFAGIRSDGSFFLAMMDDTGSWHGLKAVADALEGARTFTWLFDERSDWIAAALPAESVSRSGLWETEALAAERK
jgi:hypothetical protein